VTTDDVAVVFVVDCVVDTIALVVLDRIVDVTTVFAMAPHVVAVVVVVDTERTTSGNNRFTPLAIERWEEIGNVNNLDGRYSDAYVPLLVGVL